MPSKLQRLAREAQKRYLKPATHKMRAAAAREFRSSDLGKMYQSARRLGQSGVRMDTRMRNAVRKVERATGQRLMVDIEQAGGVEKYALNQAAVWGLTQLMRALGPLGSVLATVLQGQQQAKSLDRQLDFATKFLEAFGYQVIPPAARRQDKKLDAALTIIEAEAAEDEEEREAAGEGELTPWGEAGEAWQPGRVFAPPAPEEEEAWGRLVETPSSSNVFGFSYKQQDARSGTLYVFYKPWWPGQKGKRPHQRGPLYAYFDVTPQEATSFGNMAMGSAGKAVWTFLRQEGTQTGHWKDYRLVQGAVIPDLAPTIPGGVYIPRKITPLGYFKRRGFRGFSLPDRPFGDIEYPSTGQPDRGTPNTGAPNRAEPYRARGSRGSFNRWGGVR